MSRLNEPVDMNDAAMSLIEHLDELRRRLVYAVICLLICCSIAYIFSQQLFLWLAYPLQKAWQLANLGTPELHFANPVEPFFTYMKVSLLVGFFSAAPFVFYHLWRFIAPGLYRTERRYALGFAIASSIFFVGGAAFAYFVLFPLTFRFFLGFAQTDLAAMQQLFGKTIALKVNQPLRISPTLMMGEYFDLVWHLMVAAGLLFELPLAIFFLSIAGIISATALWRFNRYFVIVALLLGGILTPGPDVLSQVLLSAPLIILYNLSILFSWIVERRRAKRVL